MSAQQRHRALRQKKKKERENNTQNNSKSQKQQQQNAGHISFTSLCHRRNEKEIGRSGDNRVFTASAILSEKKKMVKGFVAHARPPPRARDCGGGGGGGGVGGSVWGFVVECSGL